MDVISDGKVNLKYQFSYLTLYTAAIPVQKHILDKFSENKEEQLSAISTEVIQPNKSLAIINASREHHKKTANLFDSELITYPFAEHKNYFINLKQSFDSYLGKFSSKTRNTIKRKIKKFQTLSGGDIDFRMYSQPDQIQDFFDIAVPLSKKTYQEKLLNSGLPDSAEYIAKSIELAKENKLRAYLLFHEGQAVSYLFCPIKNGILEYAYLGYSPDYSNHSVGTVLQYLALEQIFKEEAFNWFDFTEGESSHKQLFATDAVECTNLLILKNTIKNRSIVKSHKFMLKASSSLGSVMESLKLKSTIKKLLRRW